MSRVGAQRAYPVREPGDVGEVRRAAVALASAVGLDDTDQGRVALVVTEAGRNVVKHGGGGEMLLGATSAPAGIEILALDKGPGMSDVARCLADGYSTAGSPGTGLGALTRLSSEFDVYSTKNLGTALLARCFASKPVKGAPAGRLHVGAVCLPLRGELIPGDGWALVEQDERAVALVSDGLGHGPLAASASVEAVRVFSQNAAEPPDQLVLRIDAALRSTRGAAVAVAEIPLSGGPLRFCGVGNISAGVYTGGGSRSFVSHNGTAGLQVRKVQVFEYEWAPRAHLIMHSDGLSSRWDLQDYPGLLARDPSTIAGVLYRDHARPRDDVTVLVAREREAG